ncbi:MAG TPA: NADH-quinone oxidoreductase subunit C [bacterium]
MSWELAERLTQRFPDVELFPRAEEAREPGTGNREPETQQPAAESAAPQPAESTTGEPEAAAPAAPAAPMPPTPPKRPAHEAAPTFLTAGVFVPKDQLLEVCRTLATDPEFGLSYLSFVSGIDRPEAGDIEVLYHLYSLERRDELVLKVRVKRDQASVPSVTSIWNGANWHEREAYDLLGITFEGHPDLRRIMMTEDWIGHPLRKDYVYEDPAWLTEVAKQRQKEAEGFGLGERA